MDIAFPFHLSSTGRAAPANHPDHLRQLVEQVLFTGPGERVNRPEFGCDLGQLVFAPNGDEMTAAAQFLLQGALQRWLGEVIRVDALEITAADATFTVKIVFVDKRSGVRTVAEFTRTGLS